MAKTGGWAKKLMDKSRANATKQKLGGQRAVITRNASPYAEKVAALNDHKALIESGCNLGTPLTWVGAGKRARTFHGDGLVDDSLAALKAPKTNAERAKADKRTPLDREMRNDWTARPYKRQADNVGMLLRAISKG